MDTTTLKARSRDQVGTRITRKLRAEGEIPAIVYGHGEAPEAIALSLHDVEVALAHGARTLEVAMGRKKSQFLIKAIQYDHLGATPIHLDLARVALDERVRVRVGIELRGTPKGVADGGVLEQHLADIEVECLVTQIPDTLHPLVSELELGASLLVKDIELPDGVQVTGDPEERVATVRAIAEEEEVEATDEEVGDTSEPERIGRVRKDEPEADKKK